MTDNSVRFRTEGSEHLIVAAFPSRTTGAVESGWADIAHQQAEQVEAHLLEFFGSYANAAALAHLYVIEHNPIRLESTPQPDGTVTLRATSTWRLRLKTDEELSADEEPGVSQNRS